MNIFIIEMKYFIYEIRLSHMKCGLHVWNATFIYELLFFAISLYQKPCIYKSLASQMKYLTYEMFHM